MNATAAKTETETVTCPKCFGGRSFAVWSHYAGGLCFRCNGAGVVDASTPTASTVLRAWPSGRAYSADWIAAA